MRLIRQNWFVIALAGVCLITLIDVTGTLAAMGKWFQGPQRSGCSHLHNFFLLGPRSKEGRNPGRAAGYEGSGDCPGAHLAVAPLALSLSDRSLLIPR